MVSCMCCGVTGSALMVRVGREAYQRMLAEPHVRPMQFAGRRPTGFVLVDPEGYQNDTALATWIQRGLDFVATLPAKQPAGRTPRRKTLRR
jgi:TfoX N-terminal domain